MRIRALDRTIPTFDREPCTGLKIGLRHEPLQSKGQFQYDGRHSGGRQGIAVAGACTYRDVQVTGARRDRTRARARVEVLAPSNSEIGPPFGLQTQ
jgi:hypothetical protein